MSVIDCVGKTGRILDGQYSGWNIKVLDDSAVTGGYLICYWPENPSEGFDDWVDSMSSLNGYFDEFGARILWPINDK